MKAKLLYVYIALFIAVIALPLAFTPFAAMGDIRAPADFGAFFESSFGLRSSMITLGAHILAPLGASGARQVVVGRDGWLFFRETMDDYVGVTLDDQLIAAAARVCAALSAKARGEGSALIIAIAPNKASVYPEYMPFYIQQARYPTNRALLEDALLNEGVAVCRLYDALIACKPLYETPLYSKEDTHWNALGAAVAARELLGCAAAMDASFAFDDPVPTDIRIAYDGQGDLRRLLYPGEAGRDLRVIDEAPLRYTSRRPIHTGEEQHIETYGDVNAHALYMVRDSFANALVPYLSSAFGSAEYTRSMEPEAFDMPANAVIIIEVAERRIPALCEALSRL